MSRRILSSELKDEIRRRVDIVELVSAHAALKKSGRYYKGLCPFHQEKTPSFHVDPDRGLFHCFGCGQGGDMFDFLMLTASLSFMEAAEALARRAGVQFDTSPQAQQRASEREQLLRALDAARAYFRSILLGQAGQKARRYLGRRGVNDAVAEAFSLGYAPPGWDGLLTSLKGKGYTAGLLERTGLVQARAGGDGYFDIFRDRLIFPIADLQDRTVAFGGRALDQGEPVYLNSRETPAFSKGRTLYGLGQARDAIRERDEVLMVEGQMDVLAAHQFGFGNAVASLGTALTADHVGLLRRFATRVVLIYDSDRAGETATERGLLLFEEGEVDARVAVLPSGEDPDECLRKRGPEAFGRLIIEALPMFDYRVQVAARRHDASTREGKIGLADEVLTVIQSVANPVRRVEYLRALAGRLDLPEDALRQRLRMRGRPGRSPRSAVASRQGASPRQSPRVHGVTDTARGEQGSPAELLPRAERAREEAERFLLHIMVQEPERRVVIGKALRAETFANPVHQQLAAALISAPSVDVGGLREQVDAEAAGLLMRLAFEAPPVTDHDRDRAVDGALRYLTRTEPAAVERRRVWDALQAAQAGGDEAEVRRLQAAYADLVIASKRGDSQAR